MRVDYLGTQYSFQYKDKVQKINDELNSHIQKSIENQSSKYVSETKEKDEKYEKRYHNPSSVTPINEMGTSNIFKLINSIKNI